MNNLWRLKTVYFKKNCESIKKLDGFIAGLIAVGFTAFLVLLANRASVNFDAAYNLLSYQNLFEGKGFIYDYDGKYMPFDPVISTGPELYLPVFAVWKIIGHTDYFVSVYVVVAYYAIFLGFLIFYTQKDSNTKTLSVLTFAFLFLCNRKIFDNYFPVIPLGEIIAPFFIFAGVYFLGKKKYMSGFAFLGLAIDVKTNTVIAVIPTLICFLLFEVVIPKIKERNIKELFKTTLSFALLSLLVFVPYLVYSKIIPSMVLTHKEKRIVKKAQKDRARFMKERGFGQIIALKENPDKEGMMFFFIRVKQKVKTLQSWFRGSALLLGMFVSLLIALTFYAYRQKHFSFYLFLCSVFVALWWLLGAYDDWYRYFFPAELLFSFGIIALVPALLQQKNRAVLLCIGIAVIMLFAPQFSLSSIENNFDESDRNNFIFMKTYIRTIDEKNIFTYGWFQCPQLMLLANKRFQDFTNKESLVRAKKDGRELFLLTTAENAFIEEEMKGLIKDCDLIQEYWDNKLYRIK
jgi:hypothetical protein